MYKLPDIGLILNCRDLALVKNGIQTTKLRSQIIHHIDSTKVTLHVDNKLHIIFVLPQGGGRVKKKENKW